MVGIRRNLEQPIAEMRPPIRAETRTGDTPQMKRERQRRHAPQILMTTPEILALLLSCGDVDRIFGLEHNNAGGPAGLPPARSRHKETPPRRPETGRC
ncbi:MAG: hypothetical protein ACRC67_16850 [Inquilinus sp.]|uniref:hypothetical protein n=1 Tax=Inquilinus sp. TaxID=1932117 RepID=UPI003F3F0CFB